MQRKKRHMDRSPGQPKLANLVRFSKTQDLPMLIVTPQVARIIVHATK